MDAYNRRLDKGLSGSDVPHRLVVTLLYEVPRFHGGRLINGAFGGWKLGVLQTLESGPPFTVMMTSNTTNAFSAGPLRPNLLRDASLGSERTDQPLVRSRGLQRARAVRFRQLAAQRAAERSDPDNGCHTREELRVSPSVGEWMCAANCTIC